MIVAVQSLFEDGRHVAAEVVIGGTQRKAFLQRQRIRGFAEHD